MKTKRLQLFVMENLFYSRKFATVHVFRMFTSEPSR